MKKLIGPPILALSFLLLTGAAFIDNETKTGVLELNRKYEELNRKLEQLSQQSQKNDARHAEILKILSEIRALTAKKQTINIVAPPPVPPAVSEPVSPPTTLVAPSVPPAPAIETPPPAPVIETPPPIVEAAPPPAAAPSPVIVAEEPKPTPAPVQPTVSLISLPPLPMPEGKVSQRSDFFGLIALIVSGLSFVSLCVLIFSVRKSDERIRRMVWKTEVDHLRDEVLGGRPHLKVEKSYDRLRLTNIGSVIADDIKLSLGPAPATMKQRLRVLARIPEGEKAEVEIGPQASGGQLYGTLEYKNPENGRIYKDQFVLRVDSVTGELIPIQQAS